MTTKAKLLVALSAILVVAFVATSLINYTVTREAVRAELLNSSLPLTGKNIYSEIHSAMMRPILVASSMANDTFLKDWIRDGEIGLDNIRNYLSEIKEEYGFLTAFYVSAEKDRYYYPGGLLKKISPRDPRDIWYYAFTRSEQDYDLNIDPSEQDNDILTIFVNYRMVDESDKLLGAVGVGVNMDRAIWLLKQTREQYGRSVYLVDQDGLVMVHPDRKRIERYYITKAGGISEIAEDILQPRDEAVQFEYDWDGNHYLLSTHYLPEFQWYLIVEQNEGDALVTARANLMRTLGIGLGVSVLIIILCTITINYYQEKLERLARTDPLTGIGNRRAFEERFELAAYKTQRYGDAFSVIILDLDNFKEINDRHGHLAGDNVLRAVADAIQRTIRPGDLVARWGGDEFIILMDGGVDDATAVMQRVRSTLLHSSQEILIDFSCGIARYRKDEDLDAFAQRADQALYAAKNDMNCDSVVAD